MKVLLIYPEFPDTFWSFKHAIRFISKKAANPPLGLLTVAALLPTHWEKKLLDLNTSPFDPALVVWADYVFLGAMNVQKNSAQEVIKQVKRLNKPIVAGGPLFTAEYDQFPEVDHFILNEAELTLPPFLNDLQTGFPKKFYRTDEYADITRSPQPLWQLLDLKAYDAMNIQFSRGCPYNCDFCNVTALLGHRPRTKTAAQLIQELDGLYNLGWRRNIFMVDDNFIGNKKVLKTEILPALIQWRQGKKGCLFITEASINLADDPALMEMMVRAGFTSVFIGIETPDENGLEICNKKQNQNRDLIQSVKRLQRSGLQVMAGFIVGFDSDTPSIFHRQIDFIQKSGIVTAMVGLLQAPYGTDLYRRMQKENRLVTEMSGDNTDGTSNIIPKMDPHTLASGYKAILENIYSPRQFYERVRTLIYELKPIGNIVHLEFLEIVAFFRSIFYLGVLDSGRWHYWYNFFWSLFRNPKMFPLTITLSIYGFHFRRLTEKIGQNLVQFSSRTRSGHLESVL